MNEFLQYPPTLQRRSRQPHRPGTRPPARREPGSTQSGMSLPSPHIRGPSLPVILPPQRSPEQHADFIFLPAAAINSRALL